MWQWTLRSTVSDVRKAIAQNHQFTEEEQKGTWLDLGGFFVTPEEKLVITEAFSAAWRTDPVVQRSVKNEIRTKEGINPHGDGVFVGSR